MATNIQHTYNTEFVQKLAFAYRNRPLSLETTKKLSNCQTLTPCGDNEEERVSPLVDRITLFVTVGCRLQQRQQRRLFSIHAENGGRSMPAAQFALVPVQGNSKWRNGLKRARQRDTLQRPVHRLV